MFLEVSGNCILDVEDIFIKNTEKDVSEAFL